VSHELWLWADDQKIAALHYDPLEDRWGLRYEPSWVARDEAYPLSPTLALIPPREGYASGSIRRFLENLLPEGRALDIAAQTYRVSRSNVLGLILALGAETAGALQLRPAGEPPPPLAKTALREVTLSELHERLETRDRLSFVVWDGRVRMSIPGHQDKLPVYMDRSLDAGGRMFLADPPLASTHVLKPEPVHVALPHLVVNEHYCMSLGRRIGFPVAEVAILRTPRPLLVVTRFDRAVEDGAEGARVRRLHIVDACQAADLPVTHKYERNLGSAEHVRGIREGVSFEVLFGLVEQTRNKVSAKLTLLRWALFQYLIGNSDAHGKNFSFFVHHGGLDPAPWYDLVSVVQYDAIDHELAMAFGDAFALDEITPFALADFANRCGIERRLLQREATRLAKLATQNAPPQAESPDYRDDERPFARQLCDFVLRQAARLDDLARRAATIPKRHL
jgi:serine/threonine-protein kinase HipA